MSKAVSAWLFLVLTAATWTHAQPVTPPPIAARAFIVVDTLSGQTLAAANDNDRFEPASLTKIMTAYLVFDALRAGKLEATANVAVSQRALRAPGARMFVAPGKPVTVMQLLRGLIVQSANDAAIALAEAVAGSEAAFVGQMNEQARRMGLANTAFVNATGQPAPGHHASARDLATLAGHLLRDFPDRYGLYAEKEFTYDRITQANRNRLLWTDPTVDGIKTGFTEAAGYCLLASARRAERRLVSVVLGAQTDALRTSETQKLLNFGFQAYDTRRLYRRGEAVAAPPVFKGTRSTVPLGFDRDVWLTLPRDRFDGLTAVLETRQPFVAPLAAGEKAGIMKLMRERAPLAEIPVVALEEVPVAGFLSRGWDTLRLLFRR
jgi:serine-type D-Ala-D-Ala carboxypeptidase (penicillin-binding protein 5/6)